jgi:membrane-associated phospholipid phosphatase
MKDGKQGYFRRILFMLSILLAQGIYFLINLTTVSAHNVTIFLDKLIPFNEWFIIPYIFWYVYTFGVLLLVAYFDHKTYYKLLLSIVTGMLICFVIYYFYPTTVPRPAVEPDNLLKKAVLIIYGNDKPYNCFPSIHMLDTFLITMYLFKYGKGLLLKTSSGMICAAIYLSTLFVKQHSVLDAVASTVLGAALFCIFDSRYIINKFKEFINLYTDSKTKSSWSQDG